MVKPAPDLEQPTAPKEEPVPASRRRRRLLLAGAGLLAVAVVAGTLVLRGAAEDEKPAPPPEGPVVEVAQMTVNLAGTELHYARLGIAVVLRDDVVAPDVEGRFPLLQDAALSEAQALAPEVLRTPDGLQQLRERLTTRAQTVYPDGEVLRVVLTELVVQ